MSEWITDRLPTEDDAKHSSRKVARGGADYFSGIVWAMHEGYAVQRVWSEVQFGQPWQPIVPPAPYVKPKRWTVQFSQSDGRYYLYDHSLEVLRLYGITDANAAERICDIYNEVMP